MSVQQKVVARALFPERPSLFALFGGAVALVGDFANFLSEAVPAAAYLAVFAGATAVAALLCVRTARAKAPATPEAVAAVGKCFVCDAFRFSLCAAAAFALLMVVGGGKSATRSVGEMLGLISKDVAKISDDVGKIREAVDPYTIKTDAKTPAELYDNAFLLQNMRRDSAGALAELERLYAGGQPATLDAAELFFTAGRNVLGRDELIARMTALGERNRDPALFVVAGRNAGDPAAADALYATARAIDPAFPFAWWDAQRLQIASATGTPVEIRARLIAQRDDIAAFLERIGGKPASAWFFQPQFHPDYESLARTQMDSLATNIATYDRLIGQAADLEAATRARKEAPPPLRFEWRETLTKDLLEISGGFVADADRYAFRFADGPWTEDTRIPLYHERPRAGVFELRWRDRATGEWFGPFRYDYRAE